MLHCFTPFFYYVVLFHVTWIALFSRHVNFRKEQSLLRKRMDSSNVKVIKSCLELVVIFTLLDNKAMKGFYNE